MTRIEQARAYYRSLDDDEYGRLGSLLAEGFVHDRPDRTIEGRDRFVQFMRDERPQRDTTHPVDRVYRAVDTAAKDTPEIVVRGRLLAADGTRIVGFVDVFEFDDDRITRIETYTR